MKISFEGWWRFKRVSSNTAWPSGRAVLWLWWSWAVGTQGFRLGWIWFYFIFVRWRNEWGMHSCFSPRPNGRLLQWCNPLGWRSFSLALPRGAESKLWMRHCFSAEGLAGKRAVCLGPSYWEDASQGWKRLSWNYS